MVEIIFGRRHSSAKRITCLILVIGFVVNAIPVNTSVTSKKILFGSRKMLKTTPSRKKTEYVLQVSTLINRA